MADTGVVAGSPASRSARAVERLKTGAGVIAAVAGAVTGLWTIYEKVKADTRKITAASYDTLAPQLNEMSEALRQLHKENQELRQAMAAVTPEKAQAMAARVAAAGERPAGEQRPGGRKAAAKPGANASPTASAGGAAPGTPPAAPPAQPTPPGAPPAPGTPPTTSPADPGGTPPPAAPPTTAQAPPEKTDPLSDLLGTVARTREAVDKIRKVPETFDKVLESQKK